MACCDTRVPLRARRHVLRIQKALIEMILRLRTCQGDRILIRRVVVTLNTG